METNRAANEINQTDKNKLLQILGVTFGLAVVIGGTIGVGILRSPGAVAAQLGSIWLALSFAATRAGFAAPVSRLGLSVRAAGNVAGGDSAFLRLYCQQFE